MSNVCGFKCIFFSCATKYCGFFLMLCVKHSSCLFSDHKSRNVTKSLYVSCLLSWKHQIDTNLFRFSTQLCPILCFRSHYSITLSPWEMCPCVGSARTALAEMGRYITQSQYCWFSRGPAHIMFPSLIAHLLKKCLQQSSPQKYIQCISVQNKSKTEATYIDWATIRL